MRNNIVKTSVLSMKTYVTEENIESINLYINNAINTTHKDFSLKDLEGFLKNIGETDMHVENNNVFEKNKIFIDGIVNLLSNKDLDLMNIVETLNILNDNSKVRKIFKDLARRVEYDTINTNIVFGRDLEYDEFKDFVFIFKCYEFGNEKGVLGLLSHTRVDYSKMVAILETVIPMLKKMLNQNQDNKFLDFKTN